jgi:hypothetical protein
VRHNWTESVHRRLALFMRSSPTSELADELYGLMREAHGASTEAIRRRPRLMSLNCVRAGVPELDTAEATEEAIANSAREVLTRATEALAEPPEERELIDEVDNGAAARVYLGLERGTETLLLSERRERASLYTGKSVSAMMKTQKKPFRRSPEYYLMASLADVVIAREVEFVARKRPSVPSPEMVAVHQAWRAVERLRKQIVLYDVFNSSLDVPEWGGDLNSTLALFGHMWQLVEAPKEYSFTEIGPDQPPTTMQDPHELLYLLRLTSPFNQAELDEIVRCIRPGLPTAPPDRWLAEDIEIETSNATEPIFVVQPTADDDVLFAESIIERWQRWLDGCLCKVAGDYWACRQHRFRRALDLYQGKLEECWAYLRDPLNSPGEYDRAVGAAEQLTQYGVRFPPGANS